jgi:hypothetical protein
MRRRHPRKAFAQTLSAAMKLTVPAPIEKIIGILSFKLGGDVLPKSPLLCGLSLVTFAAAVTLFQGNYFSPARAIASGIGGALLLAGVTLVSAWVSGYNERLVQTLTALSFGGAIVIFVRTFLGFFIYLNPMFEGLPEVNVRELEGFLLFPIYLWNIYVFAFLLRRSFRASVLVAFAISIGLVITVYFSVPAAFKSL